MPSLPRRGTKARELIDKSARRGEVFWSDADIRTWTTLLPHMAGCSPGYREGRPIFRTASLEKARKLAKRGKTGKASRDKGGRGERELASAFRAEGFAAKRGKQHRGGSDSPDVRVRDLPWLYPECKRRESFSVAQLYAALDQAKREADEDESYDDYAGAEKVAAVFYRRSRHPWLVTMSFEDFCKLAREYDG